MNVTWAGERSGNRRLLNMAGAGSALLGATALLAWPPAGWMFSAWMAAHLLLSYAAAPLLVLGVAARTVVPPTLAFVAFNGVTVVLHLPGVHARLMALPGGTVLAAPLFLASGTLLWQAARTLPRLPAAGLLGAQMLACALTGALVTFTHGAAYHAPDPDVALGGVLMWVAGGLAPMGGTLILLISYLNGDRA